MPANATSRPLPVVFGAPLDSVQRSGLEWPGRNQLFVAMSEHRPVVFLELPADRWPGRPLVTRISEQVFCVRNAYGLQRLRVWRLRSLAAWLDGVLVDFALRRAGLAPYVFWLENPNTNLIRGIRPSVLVYDAMDPCLAPGHQPAYDAAERECVRRADRTFATAAALERRLRRLGADPSRLPNAAAESELDAGLDSSDAKRSFGLDERPVATYVGTLDARVDIGLLTAVARRLPGWQFLIGGRVNQERAREAAELAELPNVRVTGSLDNESGRRAVAAAGVCLIPFIEGSMNDAVNSVKMFTYLAHGKPVVASSIEECRANPYVVTASGPEAFAAAIETAFRADPESEQRRRYARANTWSVRAAEALLALATTKPVDLPPRT